MKQAATIRRKFIAGAVACLFALAIVATPTGRSMAVSLLREVVEITERVARLQCWIVNRSRCLSQDRFDPTCQRCI